MSMICTNDEKQYTRDGSDLRRVLILADTTPATMPLTGENVERLPDTVSLDTGSILMDLQASKKHILYGNTWHEWNA